MSSDHLFPKLYHCVKGSQYKEAIWLGKKALEGLSTRESGILKYPRQSITPSPDMLAPVKISVTWKVAHTGGYIEMEG